MFFFSSRVEVAKNVRDNMMKNFCFSEPALDADKKFGSGYPSDPICKAWVEKNQSCPIFGFPDVVRFSWNPIKKTLEENAVNVMFEADEEDEDGDFGAGKKRQRSQMNAFLSKGGDKKRKLYPFFERKKLQVVTHLF